jgi:hypothetical protein
VDVHDVIQAHRRHVIEAMQRFTRLKGDAGDDEIALAVVVDAQIFRLESVVRWLDAADARLAGRPAHATPSSSEPTPTAARLPRRVLRQGVRP